MSRKKNRKISAEFKLETVMEALRGDKTKAQICRERNITSGMLYKWEQRFLEQAPQIFTQANQPNRELEDKEAQIADLERMIGRLTVENEALKKSTSWLGQRSRSNGK